MADVSIFDQIEDQIVRESAKDVVDYLKKNYNDLIQDPSFTNCFTKYEEMKEISTWIKNQWINYKQNKVHWTNSLKSYKKEHPKEFAEFRDQFFVSLRKKFGDYKQTIKDFYTSYFELQQKIAGSKRTFQLTYVLEYKDTKDERKLEVYHVFDEQSFTSYNIYDFKIDTNFKPYRSGLRDTEKAEQIIYEKLQYAHLDNLNTVYNWDRDKFDKYTPKDNDNRHIILVEYSETPGKKWTPYIINGLGSMKQAYANFYLNKKQITANNYGQFLYMQDVYSVDSQPGFFSEDVQYKNSQGKQIQAAIKSSTASLMGYEDVMKFLTAYRDNEGNFNVQDFIDTFFKGERLNKKIQDFVGEGQKAVKKDVREIAKSMGIKVKEIENM